jgi:hypothetical protein
MDLNRSIIKRERDWKGVGVRKGAQKQKTAQRHEKTETQKYRGEHPI